MNPPRVSKSDIETIRANYNTLTIQEIATMLGFAVSTIHRIARINGIQREKDKSMLLISVKAIECYVGLKMSVREAAEASGLSYPKAAAVISRYFKKPTENLTLKSRV